MLTRPQLDTNGNRIAVRLWNTNAAASQITRIEPLAWYHCSGHWVTVRVKFWEFTPVRLVAVKTMESVPLVPA